MRACFDAGATATGATVNVEWGAVDYLDLNTNWPLAEQFQTNAETLGRKFLPLDKLPAGSAGSTDMGNISYRLPSIHPMLAAALCHAYQEEGGASCVPDTLRFAAIGGAILTQLRMQAGWSHRRALCV